ncbi:HEAT repeat domain-containing protein [Planctomycetota bacterium]
MSLNKTKLIKQLCFLSIFAIIMCGCKPSGMRSRGIDTSNMTAIQAQAFSIIGESLSDADSTIRSNAIEVVVTTGQINFMPRVQQLLQDEMVPVRFAAALAVGDMQYTPAANSINLLLKDTDTNVVLAASYAMTRLGYAGYTQVLRQELTNMNQTIRAHAAMLLGKSGDTGALPELYQTMIDENSDDRTSYQAAEAIAMLGDESIYEKLWAMLISTYWDVRIAGVSAMGALGTKKAQEALISMLEDEVPEVRLAAAEQLGKLGSNAGEPEVIEIFEKNLTTGEDLQTVERILALSALAIGRINSEKAIDYLPQLLKNNSQLVRLAAAQAVFLYTIR